MKKEPLILIGGGGHCRSCIDVIEAQDKFRIAGLVDKKEKLNKKVSGYKVIATDDDLNDLIKEYKHFLITIGQIKTVDVRVKIFERLKKLHATLPVIISPLAYVAKSASIGEGTIIMHRALVNVNATIGSNCIINTSAVIEHDAMVDSHCHIASAAVISGESRIHQKTFIGSNSVVNECLSIGSSIVVGSGSIVNQSMKEAGTYIGNAAKKVR